MCNVGVVGVEDLSDFFQDFRHGRRQSSAVGRMEQGKPGVE